MATGNYSTSPMIQTHPHTPHSSQPQSPPSKRDLASWWYKFKKTAKKEEEKGNIAPSPYRFLRISRFTILSFLGRFREVDVDSLAPQEILEFAKDHGDCAPRDLRSLISEQDRLIPDEESSDGDSPLCCCLKHRGRSVTLPDEPHQTRDYSQTPQNSRLALACLNLFRSVAHKQSQILEVPTGIFGVPLQVSIKYANVAISLTDPDGKSFIYGYVPIVVAKCGVFLKEKGGTAPFTPCLKAGV